LRAREVSAAPARPSARKIGIVRVCGPSGARVGGLGPPGAPPRSIAYWKMLSGGSSFLCLIAASICVNPSTAPMLRRPVCVWVDATRFVFDVSKTEFNRHPEVNAILKRGRGLLFATTAQPLRYTCCLARGSPSLASAVCPRRYLQRRAYRRHDKTCPVRVGSWALCCFASRISQQEVAGDGIYADAGRARRRQLRETAPLDFKPSLRKGRTTLSWEQR